MNALWTTCLVIALGAQPVETSSTPTTRLYVRTIPPGARVVLDGKELGTTDGLFLVPAGTGKLSVTLDGQQPEIRQVEIFEGRITRIEVTLKQRAPGGTPAPSPPSNPAQAAADIADLEKIVAARRKLVDELQARYEAGTIASSEVAKAEADLAEAEQRFTAAKKSLAADTGNLGAAAVVELTPGRADRPVGPAEPPGEIEKALDSKIELDFAETPLEEAAAFLSQQSKLKVALDKPALDQVDHNATTPVTFKVSGIPLRSALTLLLRELDLVWTVQGKTLEITTHDSLALRLTPRVYAVSDLTSNSAGLADLIKSLLEPTSWDMAGGPGSVVADRAQGKESLVVSQTEPVHRQVAAFLAVLRTVARQPANKLPVAVSDEGWWRQTPETDAVRKALEQKLTREFKETPLRDVLQFLREKTQVPVFLDRLGAHQFGVPVDTTLTATHKDGALQDVLATALENVGLTYTVTDDALLDVRFVSS